MAAALPAHRGEHTGSAALDRIQSNVRDLISFVRALGWLTRRAYVALAVDRSLVTTYAWDTLIETNVVTVQKAGFLLVQYTTSGVQNSFAGTVFFQVLVDGVVIKGTYFTANAGWAFCCSQVLVVPVVAGAHNVKLQWYTNVTNARISAKSVPSEHASLLLQEYPA